MPGNSSFIKTETFAKVKFDSARFRLDPSEGDDSVDVDLGFDLDVPYELLGVFARHIDTAEPITRLPLFALARFDLTSDSVRAAGIAPGALRFKVIPLGVVGTDHVGYASFDLWPLRSRELVGSLRDSLLQAGLLDPGKPRVTVALSQLLVLAHKDPNVVFDALREGDLSPRYVCLRMDIDEAMLRDRPRWPAMPSMQTPGIFDWRLSPGSFSMSGALLIGEDGCETLLPSNLATRMVRFLQIVSTQRRAALKYNDRSEREIEGITWKKEVTLGWRIVYSTEWYPLGHSLGQIAYSLPLAPGEKVAVSVVDWTRRDAAVRNEQTNEAEDLRHATLRDRTLSEAVHMVVQEAQSGSSFQAGGALSAGAGIPIGPVSLGVGGAFAMGGASAESRGFRDVVGSTTQSISDAFHQASSAMRELSSTVVVQSTQDEKAQARTRIVANYNHSHALTILYYEVLQHHRLLTRPSAVRPVLFVRMPMKDFDHKLVLQHEQVIRRVLLDARVEGCIDIVRKRDCMELNLERTRKKREEEGDPSVAESLGTVTVSLRNGPRVAVLASATLSVVWKSGTLTPLYLTNSGLMTRVNGITYPDQLYMYNPPLAPQTDFSFELKAQMPIKWQDVFAFELHLFHWGERTGPGDWDISSIRIETSGGPGRWVMVDEKTPTLISMNQRHRFRVSPFTPPIREVDDLLSDDERCCLHRLYAHLNGHKAHYWKAVWQSQGVWEREQAFSDLAVNGVPLLHLVDNQVIDVVGDQLVMPASGGAEGALGKAFGIERFRIPQFNEYVEQLLTTPERGVFAEAKLGHCNASEVIDNTRFWDWKLSPIPDDAPPIGVASLDSRYQDPTKKLEPTSFPPAMVNIVTPSALPDPAGFSTAGSVLSALGAFRDMSGMQQLTQLLQTLSNNATSLAQQGLANAAAGVSKPPAGGGAPAAGTPPTGGPSPPPTNGPNRPDPPPSGPPDGPTDGPKTNPPGGPTTGPSGGPNTAPPTGGAGSGGGGGGTTRPPVPVKRTPQQSSKVKTLEFVFSYDTRTVMRGSWTVKLEETGGRIFSSDGYMTDTALEASGRAVGDKIEMSNVPADFGTERNVTIRITGSSRGMPAYLSMPSMDIEIKGWSIQLPFVETLSKDVFGKASTFKVVQPTEAFEMTVTRTTKGNTSTVTASSQTAGVKVGVESVTEIGAKLEGVAEGKESVTISAEGTYGLTTGTTNTEDRGEEIAKATKINGYRVKPEPPKILPVS